MAEPIFNRGGEAQFYIEDKVIYDYAGRPLAFVDGDDIVRYTGKHIGWYCDGWMRDTSGYAIGFIRSARDGLEMPQLKEPPVTPSSKCPPIPPVARLWPRPPAFVEKWSVRILSQFLRG